MNLRAETSVLVQIAFALLLASYTVSIHAQAPAPHFSSESVQVQHRTIHDQVQGFPIDIEYPLIEGEDAFNAVVRRIMASKIRDFRQGIEGPLPDTPTRHGFIQATFTSVVLKRGIVSVLLSFNLDAPTSVHPWGEMASINYDLQTHRVLSLSDLFRPRADYLSKISQLAVASLLQDGYADEELVSSGAAPVEQNFKVFTLTETELILHFQQSQVAASAAGPKEVTIPFAKLASILPRNLN